MRQVVHGIVLREVAYKESDKILTVLTDKNGQMTVSARGSRKKGGGVSAAAQLLIWSEMTLSEYRGRWTLTWGSNATQIRRSPRELARLAGRSD